MRFELLENGLDSLRFGLSFYERYLLIEDKYEDHPGYLKMAVMCIHNAVELFLKKMLANENELLIYKDMSDKNLLNIIARRRHQKRQLPLDYYLLGEISVMTVDYSELVRRAAIIWSLNDSDYEFLIQLGTIRNKLAHLGIDRLIDFHEALIVLNSVLELLNGLFIVELRRGAKKRLQSSLDAACTEVQVLLEIARQVEDDAWTAFHDLYLEWLNELFCDLQSDSDLERHLAAKGAIMQIEQQPDGDYHWMRCSIVKQCGGEIAIMETLSIPRLQATLLAGGADTGPVYFVVDHSELMEKSLYILRRPLHIEELASCTKRFWVADKNNCYRACLDVSSLKRGIVALLNANS